jgi:hypothetical protein
VVIRRQLKRRYVLAFFEKLAPCMGRLVRHRTIGRVNCRRLVIPYG